MTIVQGIDLASFQNTTTVADLSQAIPFLQGTGPAPLVIVKLVEPPGYVNPFAVQNIADARTGNARVHGYMFAHANVPVVQSVALTIANLDGVDFLWIDEEVTDGMVQSVVDQIFQQIEVSFKSRIGRYCNQFWLDQLAQWGYNSAIPLWLAAPSLTSFPAGAQVWQRGQGAVPGIVGIVDLNETSDEWLATITSMAPLPVPVVVVPEPVPVVVVPVPVPVPVPVAVPVPQPQGDNYLMKVLSVTYPLAYDYQAEVLQKLLNLSYPNIVVDGEYGPISAGFVKAFETKEGLSVDSGEGIAGPQVWGKLLGL